MTTRASLARRDVKEQFEGRVRKWVRKWGPVGNNNKETRLVLLRWVPTDERTEDATGPRHPHIVPIKDPKSKALSRGSEGRHHRGPSEPSERPLEEAEDADLAMEDATAEPLVVLGPSGAATSQQTSIAAAEGGQGGSNAGALLPTASPSPQLPAEGNEQRDSAMEDIDGGSSRGQRTPELEGGQHVEPRDLL